MRHSPEVATKILNQVRIALNVDESDERKLTRLSAILNIIQAQLLAEELKNRLGLSVFSGPFKGMKLIPEAVVGTSGPVLLGSYERELHGEIEKIIAHPYKQILNIGCSFGYYAVGLALRKPEVMVYAYDIDEEARRECARMIELNGVGNRVQLGSEFKGEDFARYAEQDTLIIMDIEGAETVLLDPSRYPALLKCDVLVEMHDLFDPQISQLIVRRFQATHHINLYMNRAAIFDFGEILGPGGYIDPLDHMLLSWENREGPTPWAMMRVKG